ncbi:MAG: hypothetical protein LBC85_05585 [Fibromonadaceae bacterium]|jgi:hypothetical protein|nr:hypothetical protein [Fibromonadaceae bacterium]
MKFIARHSSLVAGLLLFFATALFVLSIFEISFRDALSVEKFLWDKYEDELFKSSLPIAIKYQLHIFFGIAETILAVLLVIPAWKLNKALTEKVLEVLIRLGIGGMFIFASLDKIADPKAFAVLIAQYQFLPYNLINSWALILPQIEFWFGLALIVTPFVKECTWVILGMFASFIIALVWALALGLSIVCGCFSVEVVEGAQSTKEAWITLIRDLVLLVPTIWLLTRKNRSLISIFRS